MRFLLVVLIQMIAYVGDLRFGKPDRGWKNDLKYIAGGTVLYGLSFLFK